ncbi:hypothetical protein, partial [Pantoea ananatis]|uniref:hypothetical protein n=1 Tax=Pantoea ananas TaxID=553 RepID=UPI0023AEA56A
KTKKRLNGIPWGFSLVPENRRLATTHMRLRIRTSLAGMNKRQQNQKAFKRNPVGVFSGAGESLPCYNTNVFAYSPF